MSPIRLWKLSASVVGLVSVLVCVPASAAAPALPKAASAYSTEGEAHGVSITFVTAASSGKKIEKGEAALGSQFALSGGAIQCPKAKKNPGFHEIPFAPFGLPAITLKISSGKYGFSKTIKQKETFAAGSTAKPFTMKFKVTGAVVSTGLITGTIKASGGPCTMKKPASYRAKLDPKLPVAPGA